MGTQNSELFRRYDAHRPFCTEENRRKNPKVEVQGREETFFGFLMLQLES
jgi:hypothetical protein